MPVDTLRWITRLKAGDSGRQPFTQKHPALLDDWLAGDHSAAHNPLRFERCRNHQSDDNNSKSSSPHDSILRWKH